MNTTLSDRRTFHILDFCYEMKESVSMRQSLTERVVMAIRIEMVRRGMKTSELAASIDEQYLWLQRRLTGVTPFLLEDVQRIAQALDVPLGSLLAEEQAA
jgi:hypothetical protein